MVFCGRMISESPENLRYGIIHSLQGYSDGVSIVMRQADEVMKNDMGIPQSNIFYLAGKTREGGSCVTEKKILHKDHEVNKMMLRLYSKGYGEKEKEKIENAISRAQECIKRFVEDNDIDVIFAHNMSHPVNFVTAIALSRYCGSVKNPPRYILWWHDSHMERKEFAQPAESTYEYLLEGVPGRHVDYVIFINSTQFPNAEKYFMALSPQYRGFINLNHSVIYNTTDKFISSCSDLKNKETEKLKSMFLKELDIERFLADRGESLESTLFVLQHTRVVPRKRINFALRFIFRLHRELSKRGKYNAVYFFVSGPVGLMGEKTRANLLKLHRDLCEKYGTEKVFLRFADKENPRSRVKFEDVPRVFAALGGISTYFSEIEGFGNNLLEVMASGLVPIVYTYPVFKKDLSKFNFKTVALEEFKITKYAIMETISIIENERKRKSWIDRNLQILDNNFQHKVMADKLQMAINKKET